MSKKKIAIYFFAVLPIVMVALFYQKLPDLVPMQWGSEGVSRYGGKWQLLFIAGINILIGIFMPIMAKIDPRKDNYAKFYSVYENIILLIEVFLAVIMAITISECLYPGKISVARVVSGGVGLLFVFLGNIMPKIKSNFFTGIKTPWALSSEAVWNKTQRLGGKLFFFGGFFMVVGAVFAPIAMMPFVVGILVTAIVILPIIMSYIWYQEEIRLLNK
ncbi:immunity protein SdpI [Anaerotignum neopropionicum]|uniref:Immunity protein SdpI n=1 Tax=Anaerotignum neopropionicum TaxID=36847 RepID=A0A136WAZ6_9FIRM|nr:SdpI family protein [Anaerotignum neopropionicum]KXL51683.1 immunity protein SdpI [Anaerotignum neopropionicum]